ncbi:uncharacterized protein METZ01_LOCUS263886 [marine metagenome]|uniref:Uncharacterized protein n=1 Tax=marine metagenome TaxID=408172 RepID=A0A382JI40_9ZZZZ
MILSKNLAFTRGFPVLLAEREGFEPPLHASVNRISSAAHSARLCHLSFVGKLIILSYNKETNMTTFYPFYFLELAVKPVDFFLALIPHQTSPQ